MSEFASFLTSALATFTANLAEPCMSTCVRGNVSTKTLPEPLFWIVTVIVESTPT